MSISRYYLKLRSNVILDGDVRLAYEEVSVFFEKIEYINIDSLSNDSCVPPKEYALSNTRAGEVIGFLGESLRVPMHALVMKLSFIQEVWFGQDYFSSGCNDFEWMTTRNINGKVFCMAIPFMAASELLSKFKLKQFDENLFRSLIENLSNPLSSNKKRVKITTGGTSTPHVHNLHTYKAKFFPRLVRYIINSFNGIPKMPNGDITLLDPFVGSGTSLIEASLLGIDSYGIDIDNLSCKITESKIDALNIETSALHELYSFGNADTFERDLFTVETPEIPNYVFPKVIAKKFDRWGKVDEQRLYEVEITNILKKIARIKSRSIKLLLEVCLSDALTRKFNIRMMGTGVGRFALEIAQAKLSTLMSNNVKALVNSILVANLLKKIYDIAPSKAQVIHGTAVNLPFDDAKFSLILTSPPYLPASSGREDYLIGKIISATALKIINSEDIEKKEQSSVGSMNASYREEDIESLPYNVHELYKWLKGDSLREIKAEPTYAYYSALKNALKECFRVLMPGGIAVFVIGKESVFYKFKTREVLYRVECDKILNEIAVSCGFFVESQSNIELDKKNKNARPRSLDSYYETVVVFRKPNEVLSERSLEQADYVLQSV